MTSRGKLMLKLAMEQNICEQNVCDKVVCVISTESSNLNTKSTIEPLSTQLPSVTSPHESLSTEDPCLKEKSDSESKEDDFYFSDSDDDAEYIPNNEDLEVLQITVMKMMKMKSDASKRKCVSKIQPLLF
ncbi:hypothetical protein HHI36_013405 [Cryptolaemus montrouzieri]|uniref:Uncharacterized protein n=1 Tax=Cryptolaemus montrouzieri TaxID=559131 RepID=A0ABD2NI68_9CUCU